MFGELPKLSSCSFKNGDFQLSNYSSSHSQEYPLLALHHANECDKPLPQENKRTLSVIKNDLVRKNNSLLVYETTLSKLLHDLVLSTRLDPLAEQPQVDEITVSIANLRHIDPPPQRLSETITSNLTSNQLKTKSLPARKCHKKLVTSTKSLLYNNGFTDASTVAVDSLASAADKFYSTLCQALRYNTDSLINEKTADSQKVVWLSLAQCNVGSAEELVDNFKTTHVETYIKLSEKCQTLYDLYQKIKRTGVIPLAQYYNLIHNICNADEPVVSEVESPAAVETNNSVEDYDYDDAQQLLELAGLSGFDIQIQDDDADAELLNSTLQELSSQSHDDDNIDSSKKRKSSTKSKSPKRKK